jgi:hypothetical protein
MADQPSHIQIGDVSGNAVAGQHIRVGNMAVNAAAPASPSTAPSPAGLTQRLGFVVDAVEYGKRSAPQRADIAQRLRELVVGLVADAGSDVDQADIDGVGDGMVVFLPVGTDPTAALPGLLTAMSDRLARDNNRFRDRLRLRMAIGSGLAGRGPTGFLGELVIELGRLVDSEPLRNAVTWYPQADCVALVSNTLHDEVIRPGHIRPDLGPFSEVTVVAKEYTRTAWLWFS